MCIRDRVKSVGDQRRQTAGIVADEVGGAPGQLIKDRTNSFALKILLGNATISTVVGNLTLEATAGTFNAAAVAGAANITSGAATTVSAGGALNLVAIGTTTIKGALINLN